MREDDVEREDSRQRRRDWRQGRRRHMTYTPISVNNPVTPGSALLTAHNGRGQEPNLGPKPRVEGVKGENCKAGLSSVNCQTSDQSRTTEPRIEQPPTGPAGQIALSLPPILPFTSLFFSLRSTSQAAISHRERLHLQTNFLAKTNPLPGWLPVSIDSWVNTMDMRRIFFVGN